MFEIADSSTQRKVGAKITVIGVGGAGCNAVNTMIRSGLDGVNYIVANTDSQALEASLSEVKIQMGTEMTKGLGAGANPEVGKKAALEDFEVITEALENSDLVFITAGMGGGTGTGAAPVISKLAKDLGALTVGVVTKPFAFEGRKRMKQALKGIEDLSPNVDSLITIPNEKLLEVAGENLSLVETFKQADEVLLNAVKGIADLINNTGLINSDFADVATIMGNKGTAIMGTGFASGEDRALKAAQEAITSPLLEDAKINGATGVIVNITGSQGITTFEANQAMKFIMEEADEDAEVIFGTVIDPDIGEEVKVTVIATGLNQAPESRRTTFSSEFEKSHDESQRSFANFSKDADSMNMGEYNEQFEMKKVDEAIKERTLLAEAITNEMQTVHESPSPVSSEETEENIERVEADSAPVAKSSDKSRLSQRTKSIAERLGFLSFDEDEFDTPSFMRADEEAESDKRAEG